MGASAYLWAALPAVVLSTFLLARAPKPARWIPCGLSALPWATFPWLAIVTFVPRGENRQWFKVAWIMCFAFAACVMAPVCLRIAQARRARLSQQSEYE
jgi:hypothetical protein